MFKHSGTRRYSLRHRLLMMMTVLCLPALTATGQSVPLWVRTTTTEAEAGAAIGTETSTGTATDTAPIGVATMSPALTDPDELFTRVSSEPPSPMTEPWSEPVSVLTLGPEVTPPDFLASSVTPPAVPPETPAEFPITLPPSKKPGCADEAFDLNSDDEEENKRLSFQQLMREPYAVYRTYESSLAWLPAGGEDFGWLDWETEPYLLRRRVYDSLGHTPLTRRDSGSYLSDEVIVTCADRCRIIVRS